MDKAAEIFKGILDILAGPIVVMTFAWLIVDQLQKKIKGRARKWFVATTIGFVLLLGLHFVASSLQGAPTGEMPAAVLFVVGLFYYGPGVAGYVLAAIFGILAGAATPFAHDHVIPAWLKKKKGGEA